MVAIPLLWLGLGGTLLVLVLLGIDTDGLLLIAGLSALALGLLTSLVSLPAAAGVVAFAAVVLLGYGALRRWSRRQGDRPIPPAARAELAEVTESMEAGGEGRVRWQGQSWAALNLDSHQALPHGCEVTVMGREGTRLQVLPRGRLPGPE